MWPSPIFIYGPQLMPTIIRESNSATKRSLPQRSTKVLVALWLQVSSWLPGSTKSGCFIRLNISLEFFSSASEPSLPRSPFTITKSKLLLLISSTALRSSASLALPGVTWRSLRTAMRCAIAAGAAVRARASKNRDNFMVQKVVLCTKLQNIPDTLIRTRIALKNFIKKENFFARVFVCISNEGQKPSCQNSTYYY